MFVIYHFPWDFETQNSRFDGYLRIEEYTVSINLKYYKSHSQLRIVQIALKIKIKYIEKSMQIENKNEK